MKIFVVDLAKYNANKPTGEWIELPSTDIWEDVKRICGKHEWAVHDYEDMPFEIHGEHPDLESLNDLADVIEKEMRNDSDLVEAVLTHADGMGFDLDDMFFIIRDREFLTLDKIDDADDLGRRYLEDAGPEIPEWIRPYFDYEEYGQDLMRNSGWDIVNGYGVCITK